MAGLTSKQEEICNLISLGFMNKEIAIRLGISPRTVEYHREVIYKKLGVRNAVELVRSMLSIDGEKVHG